MDWLEQILADHQTSAREVGVSLGVCPETVRLWRRRHRLMPPGHVILLERRFGIPRHLLRPDLWEAPGATLVRSEKARPPQPRIHRNQRTRVSASSV